MQPSIHLKAFTAVEIVYFAKKYGMTIDEVLQALRAAGLDSLPGGGAEIFAPRVRKKICDDKCDADEWLEVHRVAHKMGLRSNCTMLYGHIETVEERVDHMLRLRALQDETGGFQTFIPLAFHPENNALMKLPGPTGVEDLRTYAVARLMLDNIPHLKAYWIMLGVKTAQTALWFGADDLDGTVQEERIYHMAGAATPQVMRPNEIVRIIRNAGRTPVERDTLYNVVAEGDGAGLRQAVPPRRAPQPGGRLVSALKKPGAKLRRRLVPERAAHHLRARARPRRRTFELSFELPSRCAELLAAGEVDLGLIPGRRLRRSRRRAARRPRHRHREPRRRAHGAAGRRGAVERAEAIALDGASRSSAALLKLLCRERGLSPRFREVPHDEVLGAAARHDRRAGHRRRRLRGRREATRTSSIWARRGAR